VQRGVLPDVPGLYPWDRDEPPVDAVVISHGHQDHYGFVPLVRPGTPVLASRGTVALMEVSALFLPWGKKPPPVMAVYPDQPTVIGPFTITGIPVDHSAPDALALLVEADGQRVFYSGDLRAHGHQSALFEELVRKPPGDIDVLLLEGTTVGGRPRPYPDEAAVQNRLAKLFTDQRNASFVFCSAQNLDRVRSIHTACTEAGRELVLDLYAAWVLEQLCFLADDVPTRRSPGVRIKHWKAHADVLASSGNVEFLYACRSRKIEVEELRARAPELVVLARGNATLDRLLDHIPEPSTLQFIWSMWGGYLDDEHRVVRATRSHGIPLHNVHSGGHATLADLERLARAVQPWALVPIHTFAPERFAAEFERVVLLEDGEEYDLTRGRGRASP